MTARTTHVLPSGGQWIVKKSGGKSSTTFATRKEATRHALRLLRSETAGQVVVHHNNGLFHVEALRGLPKVQSLPRKSALGKRKIKKAVASVIRARLTGS